MSEEGLVRELRMRPRAASEPWSKRGGASREQPKVHVERRRDKADRDDGGERLAERRRGRDVALLEPEPRHGLGPAPAEVEPEHGDRADVAERGRARREELEAEPVEVAHDRAGLDGVDLELHARRERVPARARQRLRIRDSERERDASGAFARAPLSYS